MTEGFAGIIAQLEKQKSAIERALAALRDVEGTAPETAPPAKRKYTRKATNRRSEGQKARWAAKKAVETAPFEAPAATAKTSRITDEGRQKLAAAMKRRWAVKRGAVKKRGRPKKAA